MSTIFVVAGHPRCGTSMMMRCLHHGGLNVVSDVNLTILDYGNVISEPASAFEMLAGNGFPINVETAAAVVDKNLYRNRAESNLQPGQQ